MFRNIINVYVVQFGPFVHRFSTLEEKRKTLLVLHSGEGGHAHACFIHFEDGNSRDQAGNMMTNVEYHKSCNTGLGCFNRDI